MATALTEKDNRTLKEAMSTLIASYDRQINSKNNELIKETYRKMKKDAEETQAKL